MNWQLDSIKSDEFNSDTLNTGLWHVLDCPSGDCCNWGGGEAYQKGNVTVSGGSLTLRTDGPGYAPVPCDRETFATGGIVSDSSNYSYGYYEIYAKLPGFYVNGVPCGEKFQPGYWMAYEVSDTSCISIHNEIDPVVQTSVQYKYADTILAGWSYQNGHCSDATVGSGTYYSSTPLFTSFHKYALEWNTNCIIFLVDDKPFFEGYNSPTMTMHPLKLYINSGLNDSSAHFNPATPFPQYMLIDYFHYYKLKLDCGTATTLLTNADLASYTYSVKSSITFGNSNDSISLNSGDVKYFRAVNSITINGTFTAPLGSEFGLLPSPCN